MLTVKFKFDIDERIETIQGLKGIVSYASINNNRCKEYYINYDNGQSGWVKEEHIKENKENENSK